MRYFDFDVRRMGTPASRPFEDCILAICGLQKAGKPNSLMSSLPSELTFNQMRDAARRHSKHERAQPASLHSVAWNSTKKHPCGCVPLELTDQDWSTPLKEAQIKVSVHQNLRATDKEMGISAQGLTKNKQVKHFTKPHVFTSRLEVLTFLQGIYKSFEGSVEEKRKEVLRVRHAMWFSKLVPELWMVKQKGAEDHDDPTECLIANRSGPYTVHCASLSGGDGKVYKLQIPPFAQILVDSLDSVRVAKATPIIAADGSLGWERTGEWLSLVDYVCDEGVWTIGAGLLQRLCTALRIPAHYKLDHRHRVELFLRTCGKSDQYINEVLETLVVPERKKKADSIEEMG